MKKSLFVRTVLGLAAGTCLLVGSLGAQTGTWNGTASGNWGDATKWTGTVPNAAEAWAVFPSILTSNITVSLNSTVSPTVGRIDFTEDTHAYTIGGSAGSLTFSNNGTGAQVNVMAPNVANHILGRPITLADTLAVNTAVAGSGLTINSTASLTGAFGITKTGPGLLTIQGSKSGWSGGLTLSEGTVRIGDNNALGTGTLTLLGGTLATDSGTSRNPGAPVLLAGNVVLGETATGTGSLTFTGNFTVDGGTRQVNVASGRTATVNNAFAATNGGKVQLTGPGNFVLGNATASYTAPVDVAAGSKLTINSTPTINSVITGAGTLEKSGGFSVARLNGDLSGFTGNIIFSQGEFEFTAESNWSALPVGQMANAPTFTGAGVGAFLTYTPASAAELESFKQKFAPTAISKVGYNGDFGDGSTVFDFGSHTQLSLSAGTTNATFNGNLTAPDGQVIRLGGRNQLSLVKANSLSGNHGVIVEQGGTVRMDASQSYTGGTVVGTFARGGGTLSFSVDPGTGATPFGSGAMYVERGGIEAVATNGTFIGLPNAITWADNSFITFDNREVVNSNRYGDNTGLTFTAGRHSIQLRGHLTNAVTEQIGDVVLGGNSYNNIWAWVEYSATAADPTRTDPANAWLKVKSLTVAEGDQGAVRISSVPNFSTFPTERPAGYLGDDARVIITDPAAEAALVGQIANGMLPPRYYDPTAISFLSYSTEVANEEKKGFVNVPFSANTLANATATDIIHATANTTVNGNVAVYALRTSGNLTRTAATDTITIGSGGLITSVPSGSATSTVNLDFAGQRAWLTGLGGSGTHTFNGTLSNAAGLTKTGNRQINLDGDLSGVVGPVVIGEGTVQIKSPMGTGANDLHVNTGATLRLNNSTGNATAPTTVEYVFTNLTGGSHNASGGIFNDNAGGGGDANTAVLVINSTRDTEFKGTISTNNDNDKLNFRKEAAGTLVLSNPTTINYTGTTVVNAGKLLINGLKTKTGAITVNSGATFGGTGTVAGGLTLNSGATLAPGASVGTLTLTGIAAGTVLFDAGSTLAWEMGDLVSFSGTNAFTLDANPGANLEVVYTPEIDLGTFTVLDWSLNPNVAVTLAATDFNLLWPSAGYNGALALNGSRLELTISEIPEPATWAAALGLLALLAGLRRRA